jgi:hypothetical protein
MTATYYDVLGVDATAAHEQISAEYHRLARQFHPDQHPGASQAERAQYEAAMSRINEAYNTLKDDARRSEYDQSMVAAATTTSPNFRSPSPTECMLCGHGPGQPFTFVHGVGLLFQRRKWTTQGVFCRTCAMALGRAKLNRTLWTGWWGIISFFANFGYVATDVLGLVKASSMPVPSHTDGVVAPLPVPLSPGKPILARSGPWFAAALIAIAVIAAVGSGNSNASSPNSGPSPAATSSATWQVGVCVADAGGGSVAPVDCSQPHIGYVSAVSGSPSSCPSSTTNYVTRADGVYCIIQSS